VLRKYLALFAHYPQQKLLWSQSKVGLLQVSKFVLQLHKRKKRVWH